MENVPVLRFILTGQIIGTPGHNPIGVSQCPAVPETGRHGKLIKPPLTSRKGPQFANMRAGFHGLQLSGWRGSISWSLTGNGP